MPGMLWLSARYVLEHFEKTSSEYFDFAEHEREHRAMFEFTQKGLVNIF